VLPIFLMFTWVMSYGEIGELALLSLCKSARYVASGFASEMRRRNFLVTWKTVADVSLFSD